MVENDNKTYEFFLQVINQISVYFLSKTHFSEHPGLRRPSVRIEWFHCIYFLMYFLKYYRRVTKLRTFDLMKFTINFF